MVRDPAKIFKSHKITPILREKRVMRGVRDLDSLIMIVESFKMRHENA